MLESLISFIIPLSYFILATATLVILTKHKFGKCLPLAMMLPAFLLFFGQLIFGSFTPGFILAILFALAAIPLAIINRKALTELKGLFFTSGFIAFLTVYVVVFIFDLQREFSVWDELSHWGMMVKEMFRLDKFYSVEASNLLVHKDYPPIMQTFELFWVKLCGNFREPYVERALHAFELSLIVPFIAERVSTRRNSLRSIAVAFASMLSTLLLMLFFDQHGVVNAIYVDYEMALLVIFLMMAIFTSKKITLFEIATLSLSGSFLLLLKQMGLPLYLMLLCFLIGILWLRKTITWKTYLKKIGAKKLLISSVALLIPFALWFIWGRLVASTTQQFELSDLSPSVLLKIFAGHGEAWQTTTIRNYLRALGTKNITTSFFQLSFVQAIGLFIVCMGIIYHCFRKTLEKKEFILATTLIVVGALGYAIAMLMLYATSFGESEGPNLASYDRYMGTFAILMLGFAFAIFLWQTTTFKKLQPLYALTAVLVLINAPGSFIKLYPQIYNRYTPYEKYSIVAEGLKNIIPESDAKVYMIAQDKAWWGYHFFTQYFATPLKINYASTWPTGETERSGEIYYAQAIDEIKSYDYLLIVDFDKQFEKDYCDELKICPIETGNIYKIIKNPDGSIEKYKLLDNIELAD